MCTDDARDGPSVYNGENTVVFDPLVNAYASESPTTRMRANTRIAYAGNHPCCTARTSACFK